MPGSLKKTALACARFRPSTVSSVVAPRGTPRGETELIVGGVVRLPVGESVVLAAKAAAETQAQAISALIVFNPNHRLLPDWRAGFSRRWASAPPSPPR